MCYNLMVGLSSTAESPGSRDHPMNQLMPPNAYQSSHLASAALRYTQMSNEG